MSMTVLLCPCMYGIYTDVLRPCSFLFICTATSRMGAVVEGRICFQGNTNRILALFTHGRDLAGSFKNVYLGHIVHSDC